MSKDYAATCKWLPVVCVLGLPIYKGQEQDREGRKSAYEDVGGTRAVYGKQEVLTTRSPPTHLGRGMEILRKTKIHKYLQP